MKTVLIFGTFDIVHGGHLYLFKQAKRLGDKLVVVVARDANVKKIKKIQPVHSEKERLELLRHIDIIDEARLGDLKDVYKVLHQVRPEVICLGYDQIAFTDKLQKKLTEFNLKTTIVRLKPRRHKTLKSSRIKQYLESNI